MCVVGRRLAEVMHGGKWTQAARGIDGRATNRLCLFFFFLVDSAQTSVHLV